MYEHAKRNAECILSPNRTLWTWYFRHLQNKGKEYEKTTEDVICNKKSPRRIPGPVKLRRRQRLAHWKNQGLLMLQDKMIVSVQILPSGRNLCARMAIQKFECQAAPNVQLSLAEFLPKAYVRCSLHRLKVLGQVEMGPKQSHANNLI